jgi:hypothetical protein
LAFPDTAPPRTPNVGPSDSPLHIKKGPAFTAASSLIVSSAPGTVGAVLKPQRQPPCDGRSCLWTATFRDH